jgi:predicted Zn-dependent protease
MIDLSRQKELAMGADNYRRLLAGNPVLPPQHPASQLVHKVGSKIAAAASLDGTQWEFKVIDSPTVNAACLPGGKVVVFRGLLDLFKHDETALAGQCSARNRAFARGVAAASWLLRNAYATVLLGGQDAKGLSCWGRGDAGSRA